MARRGRNRGFARVETQAPLWAIGLKRELKEREQRRGVSPKMEAAFRRSGVLGWTKMGRRTRRRALREPWVSRSRKVGRETALWLEARKLRRPGVTGLGVSSRAVLESLFHCVIYLFCECVEGFAIEFGNMKRV